MATQTIGTAQRRFGTAIKHLRDGYRAIQGKPPKYTLDLDSVRRAAAEIRPSLDIDSKSISELDWLLLRELVEESRAFDGPLVEIGVLAARTTQRLATCKAAHQKILAVDNFAWNPWGLTPDEQWKLVLHTLHHLIETDQVEVHRADKNTFYETYAGPAPAMVFLDAIHDYPETKKDILWARRVGAKIICGHDYSPSFPGVMQAVDEFGGPIRISGTVWKLAAGS